MANIIIYSMIFIIGTLLGSFFTLAVHRIPLKQDITHERSYCPNCNHKLSFLDLIPVLSYLFLGGKCRYCKNKIRPRYLILEILSGITFLLLAISLKIDIFNLNVNVLVYLVFGMLYISTLIIIGGIDKEHNKITKSVMLFGIIIEIMYITYLYVLKNNIYRYIIYLAIIFILALINTKYLKKDKRNYTIEILLLCFYMCIGTSEETTILSISSALILIALNIMKNRKEKMKINENKTYNMPVGFYLTFSNIVLLIIQNLLYTI